MSSVLKAMRVKKAAQPKVDTRPRYRVRNGKIVLRMYAELAKPKPASNVRLVLTRESRPHLLGVECPHCNGTGQYRWHLNHQRVEKCYRCNGKGQLDTRDLEFLTLRKEQKRPICHIVSA